MRAHGVVLALREGEKNFGDAVLEDGACRYDLECGGTKTLAYHATRALATMQRHACEAITIVAAGDAHAGVMRERVEAWKKESGSALAGVKVEVIAADDDAGSARGLALVEEIVGDASTLIVVHGDVVTDVALDDVVSAHMCSAASATVALAKRRPWDEIERKAGRAPKGVRYVGLSGDESVVVCLEGGVRDEATKRLKLQRSALSAVPDMVIRTDVKDVGVYALEAKETFDMLRSKVYLQSVKLDLLPHMAGEQFRGGTAGPVAAFVVKPENYCVAVDTTKPALLEASRDIAAEFHHLNEKPLSKYDNLVDGSTTIGSKSTIGPGCAVAGECVLKDKCSVKKSVIGAGCDFGSGVKISNSVIMRGVVVHDGVQITNSIIGPGAVVGARATIKDSVVGAGHEVDEEDDVRDETLTTKK